MDPPKKTSPDCRVSWCPKPAVPGGYFCGDHSAGPTHHPSVMDEHWTQVGKAHFAIEPKDSGMEQQLATLWPSKESTASASRRQDNSIAEPGYRYIRESEVGVGAKAVIHVTKLRNIVLIAGSGLLIAKHGGQGLGTAHNAAQSIDLRQGSIRGTQGVITIGLGPACIATYADKCLGEAERMCRVLLAVATRLTGLSGGDDRDKPNVREAWILLIDVLDFLVECQFLGGKLRSWVARLSTLCRCDEWEGEGDHLPAAAVLFTATTYNRIVETLASIVKGRLWLLNMPIVIRLAQVQVENFLCKTEEEYRQRAERKVHGCSALKGAQQPGHYKGFFLDPVDDKGYLSHYDLDLTGASYFCPFAHRWEPLSSLTSDSHPVVIALQELIAFENLLIMVLQQQLDGAGYEWGDPAPAETKPEKETEQESEREPERKSGQQFEKKPEKKSEPKGKKPEPKGGKKPEPKGGSGKKPDKKSKK